MDASFDRVALLFRECEFVPEEQWKTYFRTASSSKDILDVLQQEVSLSSLKDLMFAEISLPFSRHRKTPLLDILSNQIRLNSYEMLMVLRNFKPALNDLVTPLVQAQLISQNDVQAALRRPDPTKNDPYEPLLRQNVLTPDLLIRFFSMPEMRRTWPYRHDLMLSLMEINGLLASDKASSLRTSRDIAAALSQFIKENPSIGIGVLTKAKNGLQIPSRDVNPKKINRDLCARFPSGLVRRGLFLPLEDDGNVLKIAFADPLNLVQGDLLALLTGRRVMPFAAPAHVLTPIIDTIYDGSTDPVEHRANVASAEMAVDGNSSVQIVSSLIEGAIDLKATDIHIEPRDDDTMRVRYRIDGRLRNVLRVPASMVSQVISRIKVLANMDVTERRRPQDGHFDLAAGDSRFDFRVSTLPCHMGEKVVIRVLDEGRLAQGLTELGLLEPQRQTLEKMLQFPYGMILTTGPTGSGKTSTLYAFLQMINSLETNIVTIEDPVEYQLDGVNQVSVNPEVDLGFAQGLRAILRQDPDVIMVGEIRDPETASIAVRAALTGHLVFSTLHTNTALGSFSALNHLGIKPFMSASALICVVAQRLIRRICSKCSSAVAPDPSLARLLWPEGDAPEGVPQGKGCDICMGTGYRGRTGLFEVVEVSSDVRHLAGEGASESMISEAALERGQLSMADAARLKVLAGETTVEEVCQQILTQSL